MFAAIGVAVSVVESRELLLSFLDAEVSRTLAERMQQAGIRLLMPDRVASVDLEDEAVVVAMSSGETIHTKTVLVCSGRVGNSKALGLENLGIQSSARGHIEVSEHYQTSVPNVYAAGDVIGFPALASTSMEQARVAMVHAFDLKYKEELAKILPYGVYTIPECSAVGETEESLQAQEVDYVAGKASYATNARGQIIGDSHGFLKLIFRAEDMKLLGVHVIGEQATELVHIGLTALVLGADADIFIETCYNYPTLSELYKYATYDALDRRSRRHGGSEAYRQAGS
jgi:NAD(P) transhydrogenase